MGGDGEKAEKKNFEWLKGSEDSVYFVALFRVASSRENRLKRVMEGGELLGGLLRDDLCLMGGGLLDWLIGRNGEESWSDFEEKTRVEVAVKEV